MIGIFVPKENFETEFLIEVNGSKKFFAPVHGTELIGDLAPFYLNPIQTAFHNFYNGNNAVISTPTGSGKTVIAYMAMLFGNQKPKKTLYISPTRALARQVYKEIKNQKFRAFLRTGENKMDVKDDYDIVVLTPEAF